MIITQIVFLILKLTHQIDWNWVLILTPACVFCSMWSVFIFFACLINYKKTYKTPRAKRYKELKLEKGEDK